MLFNLEVYGKIWAMLLESAQTEGNVEATGINWIFLSTSYICVVVTYLVTTKLVSVDSFI